MMDTETKLNDLDAKIDEHLMADVKDHSSMRADLVIVNNRLDNVDTMFNEMKGLLKQNGEDMRDISQDIKGLKEEQIKRDALKGWLTRHPKLVALILAAVLGLSGVDGGLNLAKIISQNPMVNDSQTEKK